MRRLRAHGECGVHGRTRGSWDTGGHRETRGKHGGLGTAVLSPVYRGMKTSSSESPLCCTNFLNSSRASMLMSAFLPPGEVATGEPRWGQRHGPAGSRCRKKTATVQHQDRGRSPRVNQSSGVGLGTEDMVTAQHRTSRRGGPRMDESSGVGLGTEEMATAQMRGPQEGGQWRGLSKPLSNPRGPGQLPKPPCRVTALTWRDLVSQRHWPPSCPRGSLRHEEPC